MEDIERNNGKDQPYFMGEELLDVMHLKNEKDTTDHELVQVGGQEAAALVDEEL